MAPKPPSSDDQNPAPADDPELAKKLALEAAAAGPPTGGKAAGAPPDDDEDDEDDELELDDDDDDEDLVVFTAKEAAGALATIYGFVRPYLGNYKKLLAFVGLRRAGRDAVQRHHAAEPEIPDRRRARRGGFPGAVQDPRRARGRRHHHLDHRGLVRALGCAAGGRSSSPTCGRGCSSTSRTCRRPISPAPSAARSCRASRSTCGLRRLDQDLCQQRGAAVPGIDRRHHPDAVPELAARRGRAAGVSDHADRPADPDAEGGAGELRAEAQRIGAARHGAGKRRGAGGGQGVQPAAPDARLVHACATRTCASRPRPRCSCRPWWSAPSRSRCCCCTSWCWRSAPISPPRARSPSAPSSPSRARSGRCPTTSPI